MKGWGRGWEWSEVGGPKNGCAGLAACHLIALSPMARSLTGVTQAMT